MPDMEQPMGSLTGEETAEAPAAPNGSELHAQLAEAQAQAAEHRDNWLRATAEMSNARKRMQREMDEVRASASQRVLEKLLPIVDDTDRAFAHVPEDQTGSEWLNGFRLIQRKLHSLLESEGVVTILAEGQPFDPAIHYAVTHEEADGVADGHVIAEIAKGYRLNDKVLRPAMVRVAKA